MMTSQTYTLSNYKSIPQITFLSAAQLEAIEVVGNVFPFKTNDLIVNELINWSDITNDPVFKITFPQKHMLNEEHYKSMKIILDHNGSKAVIKRMAEMIRQELSPYDNDGSPNHVFEIIACEQHTHFRFFRTFQGNSFSWN